MVTIGKLRQMQLSGLITPRWLGKTLGITANTAGVRLHRQKPELNVIEANLIMKEIKEAFFNEEN